MRNKRHQYLPLQTFRMAALIISSFLMLACSLQAQDDHISWLSVQLQHKLSDKTTLNIKPIHRLERNFSTFQNASLDIGISRKLGKGWSAAIIERTWWLPDAKPRQFIWLDANYGKNFGHIKWDNRLRYHWAFNINDRIDVDFIRYNIRFLYNKGKKIKPFLAAEPWFGLEAGDFNMRRIRYNPGFIWNLSDNYGMTIQYWREDDPNPKPKVGRNIWLVNLLFKI